MDCLSKFATCALASGALFMIGLSSTKSLLSYRCASYERRSSASAWRPS
jgi:hypothetical protein